MDKTIEETIEYTAGKTVEELEKRCSTCGNEKECREYGKLCADNECWCEKED
jgi:hypothetical protein